MIDEQNSRKKWTKELFFFVCVAGAERKRTLSRVFVTILLLVIFFQFDKMSMNAVSPRVSDDRVERAQKCAFFISNYLPDILDV